MTKEMLNKIRDFAEENFCKPEAEQVYGDDEEFAVTNPWIDHTGRFPLNDEQAVKEWGLDVVMDFCEKAKEKIKPQKEQEPVLCGFIWCHGHKDFSVCEVEMDLEGREAIEKILYKYVHEGTSVRNAWDEPFNELVREFYPGG